MNITVQHNMQIMCR